MAFGEIRNNRGSTFLQFYNEVGAFSVPLPLLLAAAQQRWHKPARGLVKGHASGQFRILPPVRVVEVAVGRFRSKTGVLAGNFIAVSVAVLRVIVPRVQAPVIDSSIVAPVAQRLNGLVCVIARIRIGNAVLYVSADVLRGILESGFEQPSARLPKIVAQTLAFRRLNEFAADTSDFAEHFSEPSSELGFVADLL